MINDFDKSLSSFDVFGALMCGNFEWNTVAMLTHIYVYIKAKN